MFVYILSPEIFLTVCHNLSGKARLNGLERSIMNLYFVCFPISHLAQNPFVCDCNVKWLADFLRSNPIETSGARCASPRRLANKRIAQIKSNKFRCSGQ